MPCSPSLFYLLPWLLQHSRRGNYALGRKSMKNLPSLAWWLIDMCIVNAYHLFARQTPAHAHSSTSASSSCTNSQRPILPNAMVSSREVDVVEEGRAILTTPR